MLTHDSECSVHDAELRRGISAARAGLRSVAANQFERAAENSPDDPNVWLWLAWTANSPDNTIRCLQRVLELSPGHTAAAAGLAWAGALAHEPPMPIDAIASASNADDRTASTDSGTQALLTNPESLTESITLECPSSEVDHALEIPVEPTAEPAQEQHPVLAELNPESDSTAASEPVASDGIAELPHELLAMDSLHLRWSELVQRNLGSPEDAAWSNPVPPPLPSAVPPPLPTLTAPTQAEPEPLALSPSLEAPVAISNDLEIAAESSSDVESLTTPFCPPTESDAVDSRPLVMVVDDSPTVRKLVSLTLERRGYRVISAFDGVAAIKELGSCRPDLILLDINMPRLDGYRLCKLIKKHEATQSIPVVMLSGKDGMFDKLRGRLVGCSDYITKPFEADALTHKVAKYLTPASSSL